MQQVLVGVFDRAEAAHEAHDDLLKSGFAADRLRLASSRGELAERQDSVAESVARSNSVADTIGDLFRSLVGDWSGPSEHAELYNEALRRGSLVLTVRTEGEAQAGTALDILHRHGVVDIHARSEAWRQRGWTGWDPSAPPFGPEEVARERELNERALTDLPVLGEAPPGGLPQDGSARDYGSSSRPGGSLGRR
ncbi:hypothetical protein [Caldimonas brevitalea]|uniref:Uncharacterized protein n=1 Tax=Caldimonas brevitalea TaxID=413882 RepID=A0A0G3BR72_9BURK|nr:hypothetical protein [Caldimonas brevitalea]AKJ29851.1 hypothetical protein AAW51_3160 [Caldimonas brevitalea]